MAMDTALVIGMIGLTWVMLEVQKYIDKDNEWFRILFYFVFIGFVLADIEILRQYSIADATLSFATDILTTLYWIGIVIMLLSILFTMFKLLVGVWKWLLEKVK